MSALKAMKNHFAQIWHKNVSVKDLRVFLGILAGICLVFALTPLLKGAQVRLWLLVLFGLCVACLFYPAPLRPLYRAWLIFGEIMGFCISRTILFVLFFGIFTPIGLVFRVMRRDCLAQHFELDAQSYFIDRKEGEMHSMREQF